jgi:N-acetylmuramic acid 6-phosphate etherase
MDVSPISAQPELLGSLISTEQANPRTQDIDQLSTVAMLQRLNQEDQGVALAVEKAIPMIAPVIDAIVTSMQEGGRLYYFGAGTSGRLGVLDASECPPTYGTEPELVQAFIAGGEKALRQAVEGAEDSAELGRHDAEKANFRAMDVVVGLSASGGAPYVLAVMEHAREYGCITACITCNPKSELATNVEFPIVVEVGPEPIAGSTRMKAGTAQKLILNMLTTGAMIQQGKTYRNLMVDVQPTNQKLRQRARRIVSQLGGVTIEQAGHLLEHTHNQVKPAIVLACYEQIGKHLTPHQANDLLRQAKGKLRTVLENIQVTETMT